MNYLKEVSGIVGLELFNKVYSVYAIQMETFPAAIKHHHAERGGYIRHVYEVLRFCDELMNVATAFQRLVDDAENKFSVEALIKLAFIHDAKNKFSVEALIKLAFIHDLDKLERYEIDDELPIDKQMSYARSLGIIIELNECKSSLSTKINNKKNGMNNPIQYYRYKDILVIDESAKVCQMCSNLGIKLTDEDVHCLSTHHGGWSEAGKRGDLSPMATVLHCADLMSAKIYG